MKNKKQREQETRDPVISQLQQTIETFQSSTDQLANNITANVRAEVQHQIQMMVGKYVFWRDHTVRCLRLKICFLFLFIFSHFTQYRI